MTKLKIGCTLQNGKYEIIKVLGFGNFGITYLASTKIEVKGQIGQMDVSINVAIKEFYMKDLNNRMSDGTTVEGTHNTMVKNYRQKFKKEAENLAKLHHPNIVKVIEVFDENNTTYYVMEYIEGGSLDDYIKSKGHLSEDEALKCTMDIANALSYMHQNRMVHLDLKPKNIMRNPKGHLYLIDFGLSKQYDENGEPESSTSIGLGTPGYAPLEQASYKQDGALPATLDVYALGASLYKMLTGKTPPESSAIFNEGFPLTLLQKVGIGSQTISIVEKAMASAKKDRYQSVDSMSKAISNITDESNQMTFAEEECGTTYDEEINVVDVDAIKKEAAVKSTLQSVPTKNTKAQKTVKKNVGKKNHVINDNVGVDYKQVKHITRIGWKRGVIIGGLLILVLLLLFTISNIPLEVRNIIGYRTGDAAKTMIRNWNIGIIGLCLSLSSLIYYICSKKIIAKKIFKVGIILSILFLWYFIGEEYQAYKHMQYYNDTDTIVERKDSIRYVDSLVKLRKQDSIKKRVTDSLSVIEKKKDVTNPTPTGEKRTNSNEKRQVQRIINLFKEMEYAKGSTWQEVATKKSKCRIEIVKQLQMLDKSTGGKFSSTIDGIIRELQCPDPVTDKVTLNMSNKSVEEYVSSVPATKKIRVLSQKVEKIKRQLEKNMKEVPQTTRVRG